MNTKKTALILQENKMDTNTAILIIGAAALVAVCFLAWLTLKEGRL